MNVRALPAPRSLPRLTAGRVAFLGIVTLLTLILLMRLGQAFTNWDGADLEVYRRAAATWVSDGNPYAWDGTSGLGTYRYAPWFAALWIPLAWVPWDVLLVGWVVLLLGCTAAIMVSLVREHGVRALPLALLGGCLLVSTSAGGNVQALMVAMLYFGMHRRSGPLWVGVAASLKLVPILYVIPWLGQGEYRKAATAVGVMVVLLAPTLLFSLPTTTTDPGVGEYPSLALWAVLAGAATVAAVGLSRTRYAWAAAGTAALLAVPRLLPLDFSVILPAARSAAPREGSSRAR